MSIKRKITALILSVFLILPAVSSSAPAYASEAGYIYNYELKESGTDKNILGTVIYRPAVDKSNNNYPGMVSVLYFSNVKQYISGGATDICSNYKFKAVSDNSAVKVKSVAAADANSFDIAGAAAETSGQQGDYLALNVDFEGRIPKTEIAIISVWVYKDVYTEAGAVKKMFTVKVADNSKDGSMAIELKQNSNSLPADSGTPTPVFLNCTSIANLNIDQIICYDYSSGLSPDSEKILTNYTWTAVVEDYPDEGDIIGISDPSGNGSGNGKLLTGTVEGNAGNKTIKITPNEDNTGAKKSGKALITITVDPEPGYVTDSGFRTYGSNSRTILVTVNPVTGSVDFKAETDKKMYSPGETAPELILSEIGIYIDGKKILLRDLADAGRISAFNIAINPKTTGLSYSPAVSSDDTIYPASEADDPPIEEILSGGEYVYEFGLDFKSSVYSYKTDVTVSFQLDGISKSMTKSVYFDVFDAKKDKEIYNFKLYPREEVLDENGQWGGKNGGEWSANDNPFAPSTEKKELAASGKLTGSVDRYGKPANKFTVSVEDFFIYDATSADDFLRELPYDTLDYYIEKNALSGTVKAALITVGEDKKSLSVVPNSVGTVTVAITLKAGEKTETVKFSVAVTDRGVLPAEEGSIVKAELFASKNNGAKEALTNSRNFFYLQNDVENAFNIEIGKIYIANSEKSSSNYMEELKSFTWEVGIKESENTVGASPGGISPIGFGREADINTAQYIYMENEAGNIAPPFIETVAEGQSNAQAKSVNISTGWYPTGNESGVTVTVTIRKREETDPISGDLIPLVPEKDIYTLTFKIFTSEMGGDFLPKIDYENETLKIIEGRIVVGVSETGKKILADDDYKFNSGEVKYMYCLKAVSDSASQSGEKWYPFYGDEMDISQYIPKGGRGTYRIGIRRADSVPDENGRYSSDYRKVAVIPARQTLDASVKKQFQYEDGNIVYTGGDQKTVTYRVGLSGWSTASVITPAGGIDVRPSLNPLGNTVEIKLAAEGNDSDDPKFASVSFKVKVPKASKKPSVKDDGKSKLSGFSENYSWSADGMTWEQCGKGAVAYANLSSAFPGLSTKAIGGDTYYLLYMKTNATGKAAESETVIVPIPEANYLT